MRVLLIALLAFVFPLHGYASASMSTCMAAGMTQTIASAANQPEVQTAPSASMSESIPQTTSIHACCAQYGSMQCNVCDMCHLFVDLVITPVSNQHVQSPSPQSVEVRFDSADPSSALKPPLYLL